MKNKLFFSALFFALLFTTTFAQRYQATNGTSLKDDYWAVVEDTAIGAYVTIGNSSNVDQFSRLWISSYNNSGFLTSSAIATNGKRMIARDISIAPIDPTSGKTTYYVTGWTQSAVGTAVINQMFVGRINLAGNFLWYTENPSGTSSSGLNKEGVAVVTAPNGDAVAVGIAFVPVTGNIAAGNRMILSRFNSSGAPLWSNVYNQAGNWMPRSIANGVAAPNCAISPTTMPGSFVITGEATLPVTGGTSKPTTFACLYNGGGTECWKGLYPATLNLTTTADAGYDVVLNTSTGNYNVVGVVQFGNVRASASSSPYLLELSTSGVLVKSNVYIKNLNFTPMGLYPRTCTMSKSNTTTGSKLVFAGPDFSTNKVFVGSVPAIGSVGTFVNYAGLATSNAVAQPYYLNDGQTEGILTTIKAAYPGYIISTNTLPNGAFGGGDGHLLKTDLAFQTPNDCKNTPLDNLTLQSNNSTFTSSTIIQQSGWINLQPTSSLLQVQQRFCRDSCTVAASYTYTQSGQTVTFSGSGTGNGTVSYKWLFGDGTTSTLQNPTHTYAAAGTYGVCLLVYNANAFGDTCATESCKQITINACNVIANTSYSIACKYKVTFTNTSSGTGTLTYNWLFDDGSTSTTKNPVKTFATCGRHTARLITCNSTCCDTITVTVNIPCCEVKSDFCLRDSGLYVKLIYSTTMNLATTTYTVYLDGVLTSWSANSNKLLTAGTHTVCLKARRVSCPGDTCCATCCKTIIVTAPCTLVADFWHQVQSGTGNVLFTNKTTPAGYTSSWEFGDNTPKVTTTNPSHPYRPGTYIVCLTTTYINGMDTCYSRICKKIYIDSACKVLAKFKTTNCLSTPLNFEFSNYSLGATNYIWSFGDGPATSNVENPTHLYANVGTYNVCLYALSADNCISRTCHKVVAKLPSCKNTCDSTLPGNRQISEVEEIDNFAAEQLSSESKTQTKSSPSKAVIHEDKLSLFPNPASQKIQVVYEATSKANAEVVVVNAIGNVVYKKSISFTEGQNQFSIPVQNFANGNYFLKLTSGENNKSTLFSVKN